jgi:hypothetical protein
MLLIGPAIPVTQGDCKRETQSKGNRKNGSRDAPAFILLLAQMKLVFFVFGFFSFSKSSF